MDKAQWHNWRNQGVGASDAAIIMNESPWTKPWELWHQKVTGKVTPPNPAMQRGIDLENEARESFEREIGIDVFPKFCEHPEKKWMLASMDGMSLCGKVGVEIKTPGKKAIAMAEAGELPIYYWMQIQHQMEVTGLDQIYYWCYDGKEGIKIVVKRDPDFISVLMEKEYLFYRCLTELSPQRYKKGR